MEELNKIKKVPDDRSSGVLINMQKDKFLLFGGGNREKTFNDFWILTVNNLSNNDYSWQEIKPSVNFNITSRFGICGLFLNNNLWIHGGQNYFENKHYADMLLINIEVQDENKSLPNISGIKNLTNYPLDISKIPRERNSHAMASVKVDDEKDTLYIFGGGSDEGLLNDLWQFDQIEMKWNKCQIKGEDIPAREMHGMISYVNKNKDRYLYIFGGRLYESVDNKIYRINLKDFSCEYVTSFPLSLCSFSYVGYKNYIIIYGGTDGITFLNDIIIFNIANKKFAKSKFLINTEFVNNDPNLTPFLGRIGSMMSIDETTGTLVIFGGSSLHKDTNYTYVIDVKDLLDENNLTPFYLN